MIVAGKGAVVDNVRKICNAIDPNRVPETSALLQPQGKHLNYVNLCPSSKTKTIPQTKTSMTMTTQYLSTEIS